MVTQKKKYRRLPGRARKHYGLISRIQLQLWLGEDHLLCLSRASYAENYKRFYLKDIQAITCCRTTTGKTTNQMLLALGGLCLAVAILGYFKSPGLCIAFSIFTALFFLPLLLNVLFGPTCECFLYTATSIEPLTCLGRWWTARKVVPVLRQHIEAVQGRLETTASQDTPNEATEDAALVQNSITH